jgi:CRP/FNR family transcriptional regulator, cyclic AMP receptor protein
VIQQFLRSVPLFRDLDDEDLSQVLMVGLVKRYAAGTVILHEGTPGGQLQVIQEGKVRISKVVPGVGEEALTILGPGDFFGEIEFLDGAPASAQAMAHTDCEIFSLPHKEVLGLMEARPDLTSRFLWAFARTLAGRLRESNQRMASLFAIAKDF